MHPYERNCPRIKENRKEYATWFLEQGILSNTHVFIDETGFNVWTKRGKGQSKKAFLLQLLQAVNVVKILL